MPDRQSGVKSFFEPASIAVAGASVDPDKLGSIILANLLSNAEEGSLRASVYAVNPAYDRIGNRACYPNVASLPETPELLIVAVPVPQASDLMKDAAKAGVKAAVMITGGFAEAGRVGLEREIAAIAKRAGMRILGPNTIGLLDTRSGVDSLFLRPTKALPGGGEVVSLLKPRSGGVVLITQSGHIGEILSEGLAASGVGIRALVGTGNQLDVSVEDVIEYFAADDQTEVMALYLEGVANGPRFIDVAARASKRKPIVVFKVGKTDAGARAALTHTASMVGDYDVYRAAFRRAGLVEAANLQELIDFSISLSALPVPAGKRLVIVTNAGGVGVICADEASKSGLDVNPLSRAAERILRKEFAKSRFISNAALGNPIDLTASVTTDEFVQVVDAALGLRECDMAIILPTHQTPTIAYDISTKLANVVARHRKPVCMCVMGEAELSNRIRVDFAGRGIPSYPTPESAVRAMAAVSAYHEMKGAMSRDWKAHRRSVVRGTGTGGPLPQDQVSSILEEYGIRQPPWAVVRSAMDVAHFDAFEFPVACKLMSAGLLHKTEAKGVLVNIRDRDELERAFDELRSIAVKERLRFEGVMVQKMVEGGTETILGGSRDRTFGPVVFFGSGGTLAELVHDSTMSIAPVGAREAAQMVAKTKVSELLAGYRGSAGADVRSLFEAISRFSRILIDNPAIVEMEVNPLIVNVRGVYAVDARCIVNPRRPATNQ